jgi:hypothetical protein
VANNGGDTDTKPGEECPSRGETEEPEGDEPDGQLVEEKLI